MDVARSVQVAGDADLDARLLDNMQSLYPRQPAYDASAMDLASEDRDAHVAHALATGSDDP
eukprot:14644864-Alexandrium_andersonii.AAC.1